MRPHAAAQLRGQVLGEIDAVALDGDVDVVVGLAQDHVAHEAAHQVDAAVIRA